MADEPVHDRPELVPQFQSAVDEDEAKRREDIRKNQELENKRWLKRALAHAAGRRMLWGILAEAGTFEERYGFGPNGHPNPEATWSYRGQKDFGLRLYHSWLALDPEGIVSLLREFHPHFPRPK